MYIYVCMYVCVCVCQHFQTFPLKPLGRLKTNFIIGASLGWDNKNLLNSAGHMTKMAAMPIYCKNLKKIFFSRTQKSKTLKLGMKHWVLEYYLKTDDPGLTLTYFTTMSNLVPYAFVWEK